MLDENGKLFGILSLLDIAVLLFLIFAVGAFFYSLSDDVSSETPTPSVEESISPAAD